jgi:hypothetical protein
MRFVSIWKPDPSALHTGPTQEQMAAMGELIGEMTSAGVLVDTGGVAPTGMSLRVRRSGSQVTVTDGPFAEAKEVIGGYAVMDVKSKEELIAWTRRFIEVAGEGVAEIIEVTGPPAP